MVKYLLGVLSGILLVFLLGLAVVLVIVFSARPGHPKISADSILQIDLTGELTEHQAMQFSLHWPGEEPVTTVLTLRRAIAHAAQDDRIKALWLNCGGLGAGWGKAQEIRWAIEEFAKTDKPVYAYMQVGNMLDYYVASAADEIYIEPEGYLDLKGLRAEVAFYKGSLDKLGVDVEMVQAGKYKSAVEPYTRETMSDPFRYVLNQMLDGYLGIFASVVAPSRKMTADELIALLDEGPFLPPAAVDAKLIDGLAYPDEFESRLEEQLKEDELNVVSFEDYSRDIQGALDLSGRKRVAVLYGQGMIVRGWGSDDPFGSDVLASESFSDVVEDLRDDDSIEAVILRIDSPGGDALASDRMWRELNLLNKEKPVVVSFSDVAASGGYYMSMIDGAPILAYPGTVTGSIGVFFGKVNLHELYNKVGANKEIVKRGRYAAIDSSYTPLTPEERQKVQDGVDRVYESFVNKVADARGKDFQAIHEIAQGRVWLGSQAVENGLVDEMGGFERAIEIAKEKANIQPRRTGRAGGLPGAEALDRPAVRTRGARAGEDAAAAAACAGGVARVVHPVEGVVGGFLARRDAGPVALHAYDPISRSPRLGRPTVYLAVPGPPAIAALRNSFMLARGRAERLARRILEVGCMRSLVGEHRPQGDMSEAASKNPRVIMDSAVAGRAETRRAVF